MLTYIEQEQIPFRTTSILEVTVFDVSDNDTNKNIEKNVKEFIDQLDLEYCDAFLKSLIENIK
ncbi:MAG: hypothetical protein RSE41_07355 [Clostridia bacterium]